MKRCERCGNLNDGVVCTLCGHSLVPPSERPPPLPRQEPPSIRSSFLYVAFGSVTALVLLVAYARAQARFKSEAERLSAEAAAAEQEHQEAVEEENRERQAIIQASEARRRSSLSDPELLSGRTAQAVHEREWTRRLAHDPSLASSALETNLLRMERVGGDPAIAAQEALRQVALMASPPGSRVEVLPDGTGFSVRVAYKLSSLTRNETGMVTKHHTVMALRREIETLSAGVVKQLFDYCGSRGIERLSVSCNRAVRESPIPQGATPAEREQLLATGELVMRSLYRISIRAPAARLIPNWRAASEAKVLGLVVLEKDGLRGLTILHGGAEETSDPNMPLEF